MKRKPMLIALITAVVALSASPAMSLATPAHESTSPGKAKAYGKYCKTESKKHVAGVKGTPFSLCVTAMAKLANGSVKNPTEACQAESKKHVAGVKGTPFSKCVVGGAQLLKDQKSQL